MLQAAMANRDTSVEDLCKEIGITRTTLYRYVDNKGGLREYGRKLLNGRKQS
jgi:AcrR family transcriptional regulator